MVACSIGGTRRNKIQSDAKNCWCPISRMSMSRLKKILDLNTIRMEEHIAKPSLILVTSTLIFSMLFKKLLVLDDTRVIFSKSCILYNILYVDLEYDWHDLLMVLLLCTCSNITIECTWSKWSSISVHKGSTINPQGPLEGFDFLEKSFQRVL